MKFCRGSCDPNANGQLRPRIFDKFLGGILNVLYDLATSHSRLPLSQVTHYTDNYALKCIGAW